jgi:predicted ester cyclase
MSNDSNRDAVNAFFEQVWNAGDVTQADRFLAPSFISHNGFGVEISSPEDYGRSVTAFRAAFADFHTTVEDVICEGDRIVVRGTDRATHTAEFLGFPPSGRQLVSSWIEIFRLENGKAVEGWLEADTKRFLDQLASGAPEQA